MSEDNCISCGNTPSEHNFPKCNSNCSIFCVDEDHMIFVCEECGRVYSDFCLIRLMYTNAGSVFKSLPDDNFKQYMQRVSNYLKEDA